MFDQSIIFVDKNMCERYVDYRPEPRLDEMR